MAHHQGEGWRYPLLSFRWEEHLVWVEEAGGRSEQEGEVCVVQRCDGLIVHRHVVREGVPDKAQIEQDLLKFFTS